VRIAWIVAVIASAATPAPARADDRDFWRDIVDPHGVDVMMVLPKIEQAVALAQAVAANDADPTGDVRRRLYDEARGMARFLRRLAPVNPDVLLVTAKIADEAGRTDDALDALTAYLATLPDDAARERATDAQFRLGRIYLRLGRHADAIRHLRHVAASPIGVHAQSAAIHLAAALTATGRSGDAIDALAGAIARQLGPFESAMLSFALAVAYDRDEQITAAYQVIHGMQQQLSIGSFPGVVQSGLAQLQLVPAIDAHYYAGLLYEVTGLYAEARTAFLNYANGGDDASFRGRALAHVEAIDALADRAPRPRVVKRVTR
jgi:tetratricopeptide (TPR) repeat protein